MGNAEELKVKITGEDGLSSKLKGVGAKFKDLTGVSIGATAAIAAVAGALKFSIGQAMESERVMGQTNAVLKATGWAAGMSAEEISNLATAESRLTGIDDEVIQSGENMLLTFKNIGEGVFPEATRAMEDMAVAMANGDSSAIDLKGTAIQLGKALNDPIAGISALSRVGVTFSEDQKKAIKAMMDTNNIAGAQKVILDELKSEFGGAAEAAGSTFQGELSKLKNELGNTGAEIGSKMLPALTKLVKGLNTAITAHRRWHEELRDEEDQVAETAENYEQYRKSVMASAEAKGFAIDESGNLVWVHEQEWGVAVDLIEANYMMSESLWEAKNNAAALADGHDLLAQKTREVSAAAIKATEDERALAEAQELLKEKLDTLKEAMAGEIGKELESFGMKNAELTNKAETLRSKIKELEARKYLTKEQKQELEDTKTALHDVILEIDENTTAHEEATKRILLTMLERRLAIDGWTKEEIGLYEQAAGQLGLMDAATVTTGQALDTMLENFANDPNFDIAKEELDSIYGGIIKLDGLTVNAYVKIHEAYQGASGHTYYTGGRASGGPVRANEMYIWNEPGNKGEILIPSGDGYVLNRRQAEQALVDAYRGKMGATYNYNQTIYTNSPSEPILSDFASMQAWSRA